MAETVKLVAFVCHSHMMSLGTGTKYMAGEYHMLCSVEGCDRKGDFLVNVEAMIQNPQPKKDGEKK